MKKFTFSVVSVLVFCFIAVGGFYYAGVLLIDTDVEWLVEDVYKDRVVVGSEYQYVSSQSVTFDEAAGEYVLAGIGHRSCLSLANDYALSCSDGELRFAAKDVCKASRGAKLKALSDAASNALKSKDMVLYKQSVDELAIQQTKVCGFDWPTSRGR